MTVESLFKYKATCVRLKTYLEHKTEFDNMPYDKEKFVTVRTNFEGQELVGWVERKRLAHLSKAMSDAAYMGYDRICDPDIPQEKFVIPHNKTVSKVIREVIQERHRELGRRPGEALSADNPNSSDKQALLIALSRR